MPAPVVSVVAIGGTARLHLRGAVTIADAVDLHQAALRLAEPGGDVAAHCEALERLDTATLQVLLALRKELAAEGRRLTFHDVPAGVAAAIGLAGLSGELYGAPRGGANE